MSPNDDNPEEVKKAGTKYLWLGYGGYPGGGDPVAFHSTNICASAGMLEKLLQLFEPRKKDNERSKHKRRK